MPYSPNYQRVAARGLPVLIGVCCLLVIVSGCVVTSVGGKPVACSKCGKQCHGNHYTPTQVTLPAQGTTETMEGPAPEPVSAPMLNIPAVESPQSSAEPTGWKPVVKTVKATESKSTNADIPIQPVRQTPPASLGQSAPHSLLAALFSPLQTLSPQTSTANLQRRQFEQQRLQQQQARSAKPLETAPARQQQPFSPVRTASTPWPDPLGLLGAPASDVPPKPLLRQPVQQPIETPVRRLPPTSMTRAPAQPIQPASHVTANETTLPVQPVLVPSEPKRLPVAQPGVQTVARVSTNSKASPELHKPWNMDEFRPHFSSYSATGNPYRLVSDITDESSRTSPPVIDLRRLTGSSQRAVPGAGSQPAPVQSGEVHYERMPIFGLGRELAKEFRATNDRKWSQNHAVLQTASFSGDSVTVHNVRYSKYEDGRIASTRYYDATFNINDIRTIDLVIVPFRGAPRLAHVQASFGFADGRHLGMSIEARYEEGEKYDALGSVMRQFELIYVFADERDLMRIGTEVNKNDVHVYRLKFEPSEVREMFVDALNRANKLAAAPEFYHPLRNSCVTNLIAHVNKGRPKAIPKEYRTLLPGLLDNYAYDLKLVDTTAKTFKEAKENAKVNWLVEKYGDLEYFSAGIRQNMY